MRVTTQNRELVLSGEGSDPDIMIWNRLPLALQFILTKVTKLRSEGGQSRKKARGSLRRDLAAGNKVKKISKGSKRIR
jgi:hypothetical protein